MLDSNDSLIAFAHMRNIIVGGYLLGLEIVKLELIFEVGFSGLTNYIILNPKV